jgi:hypothetical protein
MRRFKCDFLGWLLPDALNENAIAVESEFRAEPAPCYSPLEKLRSYQSVDQRTFQLKPVDVAFV